MRLPIHMSVMVLVVVARKEETRRASVCARVCARERESVVCEGKWRHVHWPAVFEERRPSKMSDGIPIFQRCQKRKDPTEAKQKKKKKRGNAGRGDCAGEKEVVCVCVCACVCACVELVACLLASAHLLAAFALDLGISV